MIPLAGVISARLRRLFGERVSDWPAARADDAIHDMPPGSYRGVHLGREPGRHRANPR